MKKSLLLGAAAFAAMAFVSSADAGETKLGGFYMFRASANDSTLRSDTLNEDDTKWWSHRLQLNMDMKASEKTHAHAVVRILDTDTVSGLDANAQNVTTANPSVTVTSVVPTGTADPFPTTAPLTINGNTAAGTGTANEWQIRQAWLETEAWGVGLKVGEMPLSFNDKILINNDTTSFGAILLSKTFGDITAILADIKVSEGTETANGTNTDENDMDLYVLSLLGSASGLNYQVTGALLNSNDNAPAAVAEQSLFTGVNDDDNFWLALTLGGEFSGVNATGTVIYEGGYDKSRASVATQVQDEGDGFLAALRLKGKTGFGGWNGYAFYAGEDFNNIVSDQAGWSNTWDQGGNGARDLMGDDGFASSLNDANARATDTENMIGVGVGLTFEASGWTINPMLDYASIVEEDVAGTSASEFLADSAWGGSMILATKLDKDTTLSLTGIYMDPDAATATNVDNMYVLSADVKMAF